MTLAVCGACERHVKMTETTCPFCGAALVALRAAPTTNKRLTRAAAFAFSASVSTAALIGCGGATDAPTPATDSGGGADGSSAKDTGIDIDSGADTGKDTGVDAGAQDDGGGMALYGLPPYGIPPTDAGKDG